MSFSSWPELADVIEHKRFEIALKHVKDGSRDPSFDDESLQKSFFSQCPQLNLLSVTSCSVSRISTEIQLCTNLTSIAFSHNKLTDLPDVFGSLKKLKFLDVSHNELTALPASLKTLTKLESLIVNNNKLTIQGIPELSALGQLHVFDVSHNNLAALPPTLDSTKISSIDAANNCLTELPDEFEKLAGVLRELRLNDNKMQELPTVVGKMHRLKVLDLSNNEFRDTRFQRLTNDKRSKVPAVLNYVEKNGRKKNNEKTETTAVEPEKVDPAESAVLVRTNDEQLVVTRHKSVSEVRPYLVCCVLNNVDLSDGDNFKKFIQVQTKLHASLCENRTTAAVGTHRMGSFQLPVTFMALPRQDLYIRALNKKTSVSGNELMESLLRDAELARKRSKRSTIDPLYRYLHIVRDDPVLACLVDAQQVVISLPPITNSDPTKLTVDTTSIWVEVSSAQSLEICKKVMDELVVESLKIFPGLAIDQVRVVDGANHISIYPDKNDLPGVALNRVKSSGNENV
ncbi:unnamed protein product [Caenorhabditis auriculariae]|uniref:B3/B4 tRNA-binding domain-containing protein n=1 Tax=Caenorhabditis auriculariae TaxID=2777116 RepID=A0A8S1HY30_9PELO|nr:unnamed protein product [Caenorhabditis auriculariae]